MENAFFGDVIYFALLLAPFVFLYWVVLNLWEYLQEYYLQKWFLDINYITLEIKLPKEQLKSPLAMEMVLNGIWEPADSNGWKEEWLNLNTFPIVSFEMASIGGSIHFYFWVPDKYKPRVESHIYAQFPQAEVLEVPDYTRIIPYDNKTHKIMGFEYKQTSEDPIPIKTYKMLGMDKPSKEEEKIDPITQTLEVMASVGPHENMWVQFVCRTHRKKYTEKLKPKERIKKVISDFNPVWLFANPKVDWSYEVKKVIDKLKEQYTPPPAEDGKMQLLPMGGMLMPQDSDILKMVSENASKPGFEIGMRQIYFAPAEHFNGAQPANMGSAYKAYSASPPYNNIQPGLIPAGNDKWWEPKQGEAASKVKAMLFSDYAARKFHHAHSSIPYFHGKQYKTFVMSTEELATLYHFPGSVSQTPTFERIPSLTSTAPSNLPIGGDGVPGNLPI